MNGESLESLAGLNRNNILIDDTHVLPYIQYCRGRGSTSLPLHSATLMQVFIFFERQLSLDPYMNIIDSS